MVSRREIFLDKMNAIICWPKWVEMITPYYYDGKRGRPPIGIEPMLRMYLLQTWYSLSDEGVEEPIYDSYAFRKFMGVDFMSKRQVPDATTLLKFRHILEDHEIGDFILKYIQVVEYVLVVNPLPIPPVKWECVARHSGLSTEKAGSSRTPEERCTLAEKNAVSEEDDDGTYSFGNDVNLKTGVRVVFFCEMLIYRI